MGNLHLVTGYAGNPHVTAEDHASMFEATIRSGEYVMSAGACFAATVLDNNTIQIADGELMMQGRHVKLNPGQTVNVIIESGVLGQHRIDYIVARYIRNTNDGIESCSLIVLKGTPTTSDPVAPATITGDINGEKVLVNDFPLYSVEISGLTFGTPKALFRPQIPLAAELHKIGTEMITTPGCYVREFDGQTEWLNPPMDMGSTYRTTERWRGKPVMVNAREVSLSAGASYSISYYGAAELIPVFIGYRDANGFLLDFTRNNPGVNVSYGKTLVAHTIEFTAETAVDVVCVVKYIGGDLNHPL